MFEPHFGLRENPFSTGHDPRFVYPSPEHLEAVAHFRYGIQNREAFVLVTGEVGTGKTTAIYDLVSRLPQQSHVALINNSALTRLELLEEIARRFGVEPPATPSKPALLSALELRLSSHTGRGEPCILIVDEAQNLSNDLLEEIRLLSNLEDRGGHLLHICLVGQPELEEKLARPELRQLRQRISVKYRLKPLAPEECMRYIHHRLRVAGGEPEAIFPPESCNAVHRLTHGIPREINIVASQAMVNAFVEGARPVRPEHVRAVRDEFSFQSVLGTDLPGPTMADPPMPMAHEAPAVSPRPASPTAGAHGQPGLPPAYSGTRAAPPPPPPMPAQRPPAPPPYVAPPAARPPAVPPPQAMAPPPRPAAVPAPMAPLEPPTPPYVAPAPASMPVAAPAPPPVVVAPAASAETTPRTVSNWRERRPDPVPLPRQAQPAPQAAPAYEPFEPAIVRPAQDAEDVRAQRTRMMALASILAGVVIAVVVLYSTGNLHFGPAGGGDSPAGTSPAHGAGTVDATPSEKVAAPATVPDPAPAPTTAPPISEAVPAPSGPTFGLQVASFRTAGRAARVLKDLEDATQLPGEVVTTVSENDETWFSIVLGRFPNEARARTSAQDLIGRSLIAEAIVIPYTPNQAAATR